MVLAELCNYAAATLRMQAPQAATYWCRAVARKTAQEVIY
jgi:hypothetical protein